ncbi:hypothetical protein [Caballeronia sp. LZ001]|uniref:hypothetical protein n=1 Tax=Caballeronia sp. LZ001 TaxID=3038553 RepID=UPI00285431CA|nr:hypothetical protein [Caballeronia sp. LZ001]MDR5802142.1 hypothetical protein [Caballeronia sp. LZ001]
MDEQDKQALLAARKNLMVFNMSTKEIDGLLKKYFGIEMPEFDATASAYERLHSNQQSGD